jgi:hypothetical protein
MNLAQALPDLVKGLPAAFVTLVIGLIAAGIAYRQYRIARAKFKLDLFEKRHAVFLETWAFISKFFDPNWFDGRDIMVFRQHVANARFLFGPEIARFVEVVEKKALTRGDAYIAVRKASTEDERIAATKILNGTTEWAQTEARAITGRFAPYLDLSKWR